MAANLNIRVVHTTDTQQFCVYLTMPANSTIREAILLANICTEQIDTLNVGIFGRIRNLDYCLNDGDRIEIYRPLFIDPKEARVLRVKEERRAMRRAIQRRNEGIDHLLL